MTGQVLTYSVRISVKLHLRHKQGNTHNQKDEKTDARTRIWCILSSKCDIWYSNDFNDFTDNLLTKFHVGYLFVYIEFLPPPT